MMNYGKWSGRKAGGWALAIGMFLTWEGGASSQDRVQNRPQVRVLEAWEQRLLNAKSAEMHERMPLFYGEVITSDQRRKIDGLQRKFNAESAKLEAQLRALEESRRKAIDELMTPEQLDRVQEILVETALQSQAARLRGDRQPDDPRTKELLIRMFRESTQ